MTVYSAIEVVSAVIVLTLSVRNLNAMTSSTSHWSRIAYIILAVCSAASLVLTVVRERDLTPVELAAHVAVALLMIADRRRHGDRREVRR